MPTTEFSNSNSKMKIEYIKAFKKAKGVFRSGLCVAEDYGLIVAYQDDLRTIGVYSAESSERVAAHKLPRYSVIQQIKKFGKWIFLKYQDMASGNVRWLTLDLATLEFVSWHELGKGRFDGCDQLLHVGDNVFVFDHAAANYGNTNPLSHCVVFNVMSGNLDVRADLGKLLGSFYRIMPNCALRYVEIDEEKYVFNAYRIGREGLPTNELISTIGDTNTDFCAAEGDAIYLYQLSATTNRTPLGIARFLLDGSCTAEIPFPAFYPEIQDGDRGISTGAAIVSVGEKSMLLVCRVLHGCATDKSMQYLLFDLELKNLVWKRQFQRYGSNQVILAKGVIIHSNGKDRVDITEMATGSASEMTLEHYWLHELDGYHMPMPNFVVEFDRRNIGNQVFWMESPSRSLILSKIS